MDELSDKKRLIGLSRVSSKDQAEKGSSMDAQENRIKSYCKENNHELVDIYSDPGKSASVDEDKVNIKFNGKSLIVEYDIKSRPALNRILNECNSGKFVGLCFTKWDRLSRESSFQKYIFLYLKKIGISLFPTDDSSEPFYRDIRGAMSEEEIRKMKERVRQTRIYRFEQGIMVGRSPFGFTPVIKNKKLIGFKPHPKQAEIVKKIFKMAIEGIDYKLTCKECGIAPAQYYNIIKNKVYCGYVEFEGKVKKGIHEPLVSEIDFKKLNPDFKNE